MPTPTPVADIRRTLAELERLDPEQVALTESPLTRRGKLVGHLYQLHGPRGVAPQAVLTLADGAVRYYDSAGVRRG